MAHAASLKALAATGYASPAQVTLIAKKFLSDDRVAASIGRNDAVVEDILEVLALNKPFMLGASQTDKMPQSVEMPHPEPKESGIVADKARAQQIMDKVLEDSGYKTIKK
jgi:hypothetical protein